MATQTIFVEEIQENDKIMIGGQPYTVKLRLPNVKHITVRAEHDRIEKCPMIFTMLNRTEITVTRPD